MALTKVTARPEKELRIGLLGCGFMGKCHTNAYKKIPYIYAAAQVAPRLLVLCDQRADVVGREAARYGYEEYCTDWKEMAVDPRVEVFDNCAPDPVHPEPCIAALQQGKHVICEKPMAIRVEDARRMRDTAAAATGKAMCTFNYRFMPAVRLAKDLIDEGRLGTLYHIRVHYLQMAGHDPALPPDKVWCSAWPHSGSLQGIGSHAIDQCRFLVGEIGSVAATVRTFNQDRAIPSAGCGPDVTADEGAAAILEFDSGAIGVLESSVVCTGRKNFLGWEINGAPRLAPLGPRTSQQLVRLPERQHGQRLLAGLHRNLGDREHASLRGRLVAAGTQHRLGTRPDHREVPLPRGGGARQAPESLQRHLRGRLPCGRDHRRHAKIQPDRPASAAAILNPAWDNSRTPSPPAASGGTGAGKKRCFAGFDPTGRSRWAWGAGAPKGVGRVEAAASSVDSSPSPPAPLPKGEGRSMPPESPAGAFPRPKIG